MVSVGIRIDGGSPWAVVGGPSAYYDYGYVAKIKDLLLRNLTNLTNSEVCA